MHPLAQELWASLSLDIQSPCTHTHTRYYDWHPGIRLAGGRVISRLTDVNNKAALHPLAQRSWANGCKSSVGANSVYHALFSSSGVGNPKESGDEASIAVTPDPFVRVTI